MPKAAAKSWCGSILRTEARFRPRRRGCFCFGGALSGWGITKIWYDRKTARKDARVSGLERRPAREGVDVMRNAAGADTVRASVPGLSPAESRMVMAIWNGGSVHVGTEGLPVAKALKSRGVIYRLDAPSSGVIEECDVALTDEWRDRVSEALSEADSNEEMGA